MDTAAPALDSGIDFQHMDEHNFSRVVSPAPLCLYFWCTVVVETDDCPLQVNLDYYRPGDHKSV